MSKRVSLFFIIFFMIYVMPFSFSGCYDAREIDDEVYAISIGVDYGKENIIRLTVQIPTYTENGGGGDMSGTNENENMQGQNIVHSVEAPTVLEAVDLFGMSISRRVSLMHTKFLFFSEELARDGISQYVQAFSRYSETRPSMVVVVVNSKAEDFILKNSTNIGGTISKAMELLFNQTEDFGYFPKTQLHSFEAARAGYQQPVAIYGGINNFEEDESDKEDSETDDKDEKTSKLKVNTGHKPGKLPRKGAVERELVGTAVFREDKMVGELNEYESKYYLLMINKHKSGAYSIVDRKDKNSAVTFNIRSNGVKVNVNLQDKEKPEINIKINMEADIESIQSGFNYKHLDSIEKLNRDLSEDLLKGIKSVIEKTQKDFKSDIFGFGKKVASKFLTIQEWEKYNWIEKYPNADINVDIRVNIRRTGSLIQSSK